MSDLLYEVEYAKSGSSSCKLCKQKIDKDVIRLGIILPSAFCDKKQRHWHHEECFFKKKFLNDICEIGKFNILHHKDQERIKTRIENVSAVVLPLTGGSNICKRNLDDTNVLSTFSIEYAKSSSATCRCCDIKIIKQEIRISKSDYDPRYGDCLKWYHIKCFMEKREELLFFASGEQIPGFENLELKDQIMIRNEIKNIDDEQVVKKIKQNSNNEKEESEKLIKNIAEQNKLFDHCKEKLCKLTKSELHALLIENSQDVPSSREECTNRLADYMAFGVPKKCPECKNGQIVLDNFFYKCVGDISGWTQCYYTTQEPEKELMKIPDALRGHSIFKEFKSVISQRFFWTMPSSMDYLSESTNLGGSREEKGFPLKNIQFYLYGKLTTPRDNLKHRILKLGGLVVSKLTDTTAAVVSTKQELEKNTSGMQKIEKKEIEVIEESYFDLIDAENGTILDSLELIKENNIANWGSDPIRRIPQYVIDGKTVPKSGSMYQNYVQTNISKLKIKDGMVIDPESGLEDIAHIYKDTEKTYSTVLSKVNVNDNENSYYKLQLLEADNKDRYWVYRSWGRIGTKIGDTKTKDFTSIEDAKNHFLSIYSDKTKDQWISQENFIKKPRAYVPIDVDYGDFRNSSIELDTDSSLPKSVQLLIIKIFDTEIMKKTLLEFELDIEKMPLGRLSKAQINSGYIVLSELVHEFDNNQADEKKIKEATNKFYTFIPHNFGVDKHKMLDNIDIIKSKLEMLNSLLEIEIAYKLLVSPSDGSLSSIESHYLKLKTDIRPLDKTSPDFELVTTYMKNTHAPTHSNYSLEIEELFKVIREGEDERYERFKSLHNRKLLWHGSRLTNLASILSQGLRIAPPEAPMTGYMFGKGVYFADMVSKSANYCFANKNNPTGFILLCEVALGDMKQCYKAQNVTKLPEGKHSVWGVGRTQPDPAQIRVLTDATIVPLGVPIDKKIRSSLLYNEFIVYDVAQVNVKYLVQIKFNFK